MFLFFLSLTNSVYLFVIIFVASGNIEIDRTTTNLEFLVTNKSEIWRVEQNGDKHRYSTNTTAIGDVDYHLSRNLLFWIDIERREIHSQPLNINETSPHVTFKQCKNWEPVALAMDFVNDKIYVADVAGVKIDLFELDGQYHSILIGTNLVRPLDIELDPYDGFVFILDGYRIIRANMDGSSPVTIYRKNIYTVHGISLDIINKRVYWSKDKYLETVSSDYSGKEINFFSKNISSSLTWTKFAIFNGSYFWASNFIKYKSECSDEKIEVKKKIIYESNPIPIVRVLHFSLQISTSNLCDNVDGRCQHMCVSAAKNNSVTDLTYQCVCNVGWKLDKNLKNCTRVDDFLIYSQLTILKSHLVEKLMTPSEPYLPVTYENSRLIDFDYYHNENILYYIAKDPLKYDTIYTAHLIKHEPIVFSIGKHENYQSLAIDWLSSNLYFTDPIEGRISIINRKNKSQKLIILKNLEQPEDITVHSSKGFIFFLQTNISSKITTLSRARVDGLNLTRFYNTPLKKRCGFVIDFDDDRVYWYEWSKNYIQHSNLDFNDVQTIQSTLTKYIYTISIHEKWIYVVTTNSDGVYRIDKKTGIQSELILKDFSNRITKIKVFSYKTQKTNQHHPCVINNGGCSEFCFGLHQNTNDSWVKICAGSNVNENKTLSFS